MTNIDKNQNIVHILVQIITIMIVTNISDFRKDIKSYFDRVAINFEILIINRGKDSGIVVISLEEYNSLIATNYELSNRINESRLDSAIDKFKSGKAFSKDLIEE
ncbi:antitoxin YefM [Flavobacterium sp. PL12]